ncbi:aspartate racemase [Isoptericola sp. CG 20/1183]|uniref:Aspartate racemase n=1 Tax=Isoptericola halotolerans TaxID=300560 RepID=A0ABX5EAN2_9MICO|nr:MULTISPECIES: amino acid racemase [Isoptericola]PRZ03800.1 aspartate racemase [Isoptericola sp. CG 20/1183]PRZ04067.1 aspartate racemase [Isoptericola halotolerans]
MTEGHLPDDVDQAPPVGVIGGVGPLATAYFLQRVVQLTAAERDQEHVDMVVLNHATVPDRTDFVVGRSTLDPGPVLARDARRLERFGVSFLVMPCNTAHYFTQQVLDAITVPFVSIVDVTVAAARRRAPGLTKVGLLATAGTVASGVYDDAFAAHGIEVVTPDADDQARVSTVIYDQVKAGRPADPDELRAVAAGLVARGAGVVVLGCTELSVAAVDHGLLDEPPFLDSMDELVRATIIRAGHQVR